MSDSTMSSDTITTLADAQPTPTPTTVAGSIRPIRPRMAPKRSCLKSCNPSPTGSPCPTPIPALMQPSLSSKSVTFSDEGASDVWDADDWDRTPSEPARKLSYQDLLELKAIQRTLPRANQPEDPFTRKPASHYLTKVPVGLLPLSDAGSAPGRYPDLPETPSSTPTGSGSNTPSPSVTSSSKKSFVFMPLLGNGAAPSPSLPTNDVLESSAPMERKKPKNVMYINGEEISLDVAAPEPTNDVLQSSAPTQSKKPKNVMYINGEEISLDDEEEEAQEEAVPAPAPAPASVPTPTLASPPQSTPTPDPMLLPACSFRAKRNICPPPAPSRSQSSPSSISLSTSNTSSPTAEKPDPMLLLACSFRAKRVAPPPSPPMVFPAPPTPMSPPPRSSSQISFRTSSRVTSPPPQSSRITSPPPIQRPTSPRQIKVVRATRDNTNPSGMVGLSGWRPSGRQSPVLVNSA